MATLTVPPPEANVRNVDNDRAITIAILAMGGEGGGVLADWLVDLAEREGYFAQTTSVPGVAQRTGATIYYLEIFPEQAVKRAGREPVLALMPVPGEVDVLIASELMEAGRAVQRQLVTPDRTTLIASTHRVYSMTEKTALGDGRIDATAILQSTKSAAKKFVGGDFARLSNECGSVISAVLLGAIAGSGALPFRRELFEEAIRRAGVGVDASLAGFSAGYKAATEPAAEAHEPAAQYEAPGPRLQRLAQRVRDEFPPAAHKLLLAAIVRLTEYQDESYAAEYVDTLGAIAELDSRFGTGDTALLRETARQLALWKCYEDASRVAEIKMQRARLEQVRRAARLRGDEIIQVHEFLHPGPQEIADTLPRSLGEWLLRTEWMKNLIDRFTRRGQILQTTSISGFLRLWLVAQQRRWRRSSLRFHREQEAMQLWLEQLKAIPPKNYALAVEVAELPSLLKGYGDTHARGSRNYEAVMAVLPSLMPYSDAAERMKKLRLAALADEEGAKLAEALRSVRA